MPDNPGYKTTEFWGTILNLVLQTAVSVGVITQADSETLSVLLLPVLAAVLPLIAYIWSRTKVKTVIE